jgi:hypothetical protein
MAINALHAVFAPGNIESMYNAELQKHVDEQATRIAYQVRKVVEEHAIKNKGIPNSFVCLSESYLYPANVSTLRDMGVRIFSFNYTPTFNGIPLKKSDESYFLVWGKQSIKFEDNILKPYLNSLPRVDIEGYNFKEVI